MAGSSPMTSTTLRIRELQTHGDLVRRWDEVDFLALPRQKIPGYIVGFACSDQGVERAQRLRYEVFNLELNEGLDDSVQTGLDQDDFDAQMTHLLVLEEDSKEIAGTYRIQKVRDALAGRGLYSAREYDLSPLAPFFPQALECGRACTALRHRKAAALFALWQGLHAFVSMHELRWLFGCCSLTSTDPDDGWRAMKTLRRKEHLHPHFRVAPRPGYQCGDALREFDADLGDEIPLPKLFSTYMRLGGCIVSQPARDREFGTIDYLVLVDAKSVNLSSLGQK